METQESMVSKLEEEIQKQTAIMRCCQVTAGFAGSAIEQLAMLIDDVQQDYQLLDAQKALSDIQQNRGYYLTPVIK